VAKRWADEERDWKPDSECKLWFWGWTQGTSKKPKGHTLAAAWGRPCEVRAWLHQGGRRKLRVFQPLPRRQEQTVLCVPCYSKRQATEAATASYSPSLRAILASGAGHRGQERLYQKDRERSCLWHFTRPCGCWGLQHRRGEPWGLPCQPGDLDDTTGGVKMTNVRSLGQNSVTRPGQDKDRGERTLSTNARSIQHGHRAAKEAVDITFKDWLHTVRHAKLLAARPFANSEQFYPSTSVHTTGIWRLASP